MASTECLVICRPSIVNKSPGARAHCINASVCVCVFAHVRVHGSLVIYYLINVSYCPGQRCMSCGDNFYTSVRTKSKIYQYSDASLQRTSQVQFTYGIDAITIVWNAVHEMCIINITLYRDSIRIIKKLILHYWRPFEQIENDSSYVINNVHVQKETISIYNSRSIISCINIDIEMYSVRF